MAKYSKNALEIYKRLYFDKTRNETTPEQVHDRVAHFIASNDDQYNFFKKMLDDQILRPNTPCLINAGCTSDNNHDRQLCACFVLGLEDTMDSIIEMWSICSKIYASGAGAGIPITNLREHSSPISSGGTASGPLRYLNVIEVLSDTVRSGGRTRRAANLGTFKHNHPEVMQIINAKSKAGATLKSFNLSMAVTDEFINFVSTIGGEFLLISPNGDKPVRPMKVMNLWNKVIENSWECGDPGLLFIDRINEYNPLPSLGAIETCNPCGEVALPPWSVCNLGSINVGKFVRDEKLIHHRGDELSKWMDLDALKKTVKYSMEFLDNVIDKTTYIHPKFEHMSKTLRPTGLGMMGFADALIKMRIPYNSTKAMEIFESLCFFINKCAIEASIDMAKNGKTPIVVPKEDEKHFENLLLHYTARDEEVMKAYKRYGIRNSTWTCIAPTGSTALSADASYAWEPKFAIVWEKPLVDSDQVLKIVDPQFEKELDEWLKQEEAGYSKEDVYKDIIANNGSVKNLHYLPKEMRDVYVTAHDVDPYTKIEMQGRGQKYISLAISATCNLPNSATKEDISNIYLHAFKNGLKGITVFRDGCLDTQQVVNFGSMKKDDKKAEVKPVNIVKTRPVKRDGETIEINTPHGKMFVTCNFHPDGVPFEIFFRVGKQGAMTNVLIDALGRVCSKALQGGVKIDTIIDTMSGLCGDKFWYKLDDAAERNESAESIVDAISQIMDYYWGSSSNLTSDQIVMDNKETPEETNYKLKCPKCGKKQMKAGVGGCRGGVCLACGYSSCG